MAQPRKKINPEKVQELYFIRLINQPLYFMHYTGTPEAYIYSVKRGHIGAAVWDKENGQRFIDGVGGLEMVPCSEITATEIPQA